VSLLNDGKYGHQAHGNTLGLTLVRASYEPDNNPDEGLHRFTYALYPHAGGWRQAGTMRRAAELNQPAQALVVEPGTAAGPVDGGRALAPNQAWLSCRSESVLVSAVKPAEDQPPQGGTAVVIRLFESHGRAGEADISLAWPAARVEEVDLLERAVAPLIQAGSPSGSVVRLSFAAHEIKTLKAYFD
jgi:alpha-mannosidase